MVLVRAEEGVVHEVAVVARDVAGCPDGVQNLQVGLRHEPQGRTSLLGLHRRRVQRDSSSRHGRAAEDLSATQAVHMRPLAPQARGWFRGKGGQHDTIERWESQALGKLLNANRLGQSKSL